MSMHSMQQVNVLKLDLGQIEKEMAKLREKQVSLEKDGKNNLLASAG